MLEEWKQYIDETFPDDSRLRVVVFRKFFYELLAFIINNSGGGGEGGLESVKYVPQTLTNQQKTIARNNIDALYHKPNGINPLINNLGLIDTIYLPESNYGPVPNLADQLNQQLNF